MEKTFYRHYASLEDTHWWFRARERILASLMEAHLPHAADLRILDLGTGTGGTHRILERLGTVVSIDISREALDFSKKRGIRGLIQADAQCLPFIDASFDLASALDVIEHLANDALAVEELSRVLRRGGILIVTVPAFPFLWSAHDEVNKHKRRYKRVQLANVLRARGLKVEKLSYYNSLLFPAAAAYRLARRALRTRAGRAPESDLHRHPYTVNRVLEEVFALERFLLKRWNLPAGLSLVCIARKVS